MQPEDRSSKPPGAQQDAVRPPDAQDATAPSEARQSRGGRVHVFRVAAVALGLLAALLILEVAARIFLYRYGQFIDRFEDTLAHEFGGELTLRDMIRASADRQEVYELVPGAWGRFLGKPLRINSQGFRDREHDVTKTTGTLRIAVIGDSIAFGWGVKEEERFSNLLEQMLNADAVTSAARVEVLNFAVPGYNTVMEEGLVRARVLRYAPDVLVLNLVPNDDEIPNFIRLEPKVWALDRSFIVEAIRDRLVGRPLGDTARLLIGGVAEAGGRGHGGRVLGYRPELVPPEYQFLVGWENMEAALGRIRQLCAERGIRAICLLHYDVDDLRQAIESGMQGENRMTAWAEAARKAGFEVVDPFPALVRYAREHRLGVDAYILRPRDIHPSPLAHWLIAEVLAAHVRSPADGAVEHAATASLSNASTETVSQPPPR